MASSFFGIDFSTASAPEIIMAALKPYGLDDPELINGDGTDKKPGLYKMLKDNGADAAYLYLRGTPQYDTAFPGMKLRAQNKLAPMTEQQYVDWKGAATETMRANGIPSNFYDSPDDFATFIGNGVSPGEFQDRVVKGVVAAQNAPKEVKDALFNFYGIDDGHLAAYWLDPNNKGKDLVQQQAASRIGGAATLAKFQGLTSGEAEGLVGAGVSAAQASQGFGNLTQGQQLLNALPGETLAQMSREEQLQYVQGSPQAQQDLAQRASQRKAAFGGGGGYAQSGTGVSGLGQT